MFDIKSMEQRIQVLERQLADALVKLKNAERAIRIVETVFNEKHPDCFEHRCGNLD